MTQQCHPRAAFPRKACPRENGERGMGNGERGTKELLSF
jgi:hypothetical protein